MFLTSELLVPAATPPVGPAEDGPLAGGWGYGTQLTATFALPAPTWTAVPNASGKSGMAFAQVVLLNGETATMAAELSASGQSLGGHDGQIIPVVSSIPEPITITLLGLGGLGLLLKRRS